MHIRILGASACIGQPGQTTCFQIGGDTLIDCGTGCASLAEEELLAVRRVLLSHGHIDHCGLLPLLADAHACRQGPGIEVYGLAETLDALRQNLFNGKLWPDYTQTPSSDRPWVKLVPVEVGDAVPLVEGMATALPAQHSVPALGWLVEGPWRAMAFSGDSGPCPAFWHWVCGVPSLTDVICEVTYSDEHLQEAMRQGHMTPSLLAPLLADLPPNAHLWLSHGDPGCRDALIEQMLRQAPPGLHVARLKEGALIEL
ncbi:3',5'-cyclic-nucleotide phosphodiesterase [Chromobacterium phragmitis]|uniref:3',5'-cyclic-nucleotide phosphodiesterase n=1 Tax=Chromobacterium phragmitis TaxID=2202141 RepID=A0ABV0ISB3_9NEIS|nr:3',5'-cyclic-nucleotide phosphodiesterase [Chromobacterium phragmitis]AXE30877.1 3',5'-cyclic-nucleotide phosphodiesterase [Chromobacterium phragmitis]